MDFSRQYDILHPKNIIFPVTVIGCGGIGSQTVLTLAKTGFMQLTLIDPDSVEEHNIASQLFRPDDVGKPKVLALQDIITQFVWCDIVPIVESFTPEHELSGIVISAVDSMEVRKQIWSKISSNVEVPLYVDGRTGGEIIQVYTIQPCQYEDVDYYERWLFDDAEASPLPCGARGIAYTGSAIASFIVSQIKKWLNKEEYHLRISYDLKTMTQVVSRNKNYQMNR